jgi:LacI family repressor for deo operon, udp, cdd, tsx, nupC, and nupG
MQGEAVGRPRSRHANILDVAALAGVSAATVSRSLRGRGSVSPATRQRVVDAARELSYSASPHASGLASGRTSTIGVVVPFVTRWYFANAVAGAADALAEAGYDVLLYHLADTAARDRFFERMPLARRVDAVLTLSMPLSEEHTLALRALDMPFVTLGARLPGVPCVRIDDAAAVRTAVHHLLHQGHEQIAMIAGVEDDREFGFASSAERQAGYQQALRSAGIDPRPEMQVAGVFGIEGGARAMAELMAGPTLPTAVVAEYDELAIGALRTLRKASVAVPGRVSMIGMDNHEMSSVMDLTTVAQPVRELGTRAARLLVEQLEGTLEGDVDIVVPTRLIVRGSTGAPYVRGSDGGC